MAPPYLVGIDLGTTTCRSAIFDLHGIELAVAYRETPVSYPRPLWAEVAPDEWWRRTGEVVREAIAKSGVAPEQIAGVGLSGLMHAPVLLDGDGRPVAPAMLWMDQRCAPQCEIMNLEWAPHRRPGEERPFSTTLTAPKLRWIADTQPDVLSRARTFLLPKDYVRYRLTGELCTEPSDASGTGLFDDNLQAWDTDAVKLAHVPPHILPTICPSTSRAGQITPDAASETGLAPGTIVAVGGGDTMCTLLGVGTLAPHEVCIYLGTAAWIAFVDGVESDNRPSIGAFGATAATGAALRWVRDLLVSEPGSDITASYDVLTRQAGEVSPGAEGLFFLPHLMGERGPQADPLARGALVGLTLRHERRQIVRAILEGTAFHLRRLLEERVATHWLGAGAIAGAACGGAARSPFWMQLLADVMQLPLRVPAVAEAGVMGAAMLGGIAAEVLAPATAASRMVRIGHTFLPDNSLAARYDALYTRYCQLDDLLAPWFRAGGQEES